MVGLGCCWIDFDFISVVLDSYGLFENVLVVFVLLMLFFLFFGLFGLVFWAVYVVSSFSA